VLKLRNAMLGTLMILPTRECLFMAIMPPMLQQTTVGEVQHGTGKQNVHDKWKSVWSGDGRAGDGTFLALNSYATSDGTRLSVTRGTFSSPSAAQKELKLWGKQATKIIERGVTKNSSGQAVGLRLRGIFPPPKPHEENNGILWTEGKEFFWVSSPSLELALQVEKEFASH
jgi:hypothetical protein